MQQPQSFDSFKSINSPCVDQIPSHWETEANRYLFKEMKTVVGNNAANYTLLSLTLNGVIPRDMENPQGKFPAEFNTYKVVKPNDLIFCLFDVEETPRAVGHSKHNGMITGAYTVLECREGVASQYLYYYYLALDFNKDLKYYYTGLRNVISRDTFMGMVSPIPPIYEQNRIVSFLDQKTAEIDEAIAKKQKLVELLQEQKSILINQAVTKGLNPDAPMKDSGVEWIGEIPAHWEVKRNRFLFVETNERSPKGEETHLSMTQKHGLIPATEVDVQTLQSESYEGAKLCQKGDLVLNRLKAHLAVFSVAPSDGVISPDYSVFKLRNTEDYSKYFEHLFKTHGYLGEFNRRVRGIVIGFYRLYSGDFYDIPSLIPPSNEQCLLLEHIEKINTETKKAVEHIECEVNTLRELKTTLISSAVTGKIKV